MIEILTITFKDFLNPIFYINHGGIWIVLFIIFAETGLMVGFFLPGDSLLFVSGIYSKMLITSLIPAGLGNDFLEVMVLFLLISIAGVLGNELGYWFGFKTGPILFKRKDTWLFKKRHLFQAKEFYDKHGGVAIVLARYLPMLRTFAPIVAGIVKMDKNSFLRYNILGSAAWVFTVLMAGHYLEKLFLNNFGFDLKQHLFVIVIFLVIITTAPVLYKIISRKK
ncbi:MAG: VTT domain-containing protein [Ginsengibacter sp.]|jgi:membrane-associated protein